jgi:hypothetical protein
MAKLFSYGGHWFENDTDASFSFVGFWGRPSKRDNLDFGRYMNMGQKRLSFECFANCKRSPKSPDFRTNVWRCCTPRIRRSTCLMNE